MNQLFYGSVCVTDIIEHMKKGHSSFEKAQNGKVYAKVNVWLNEEEDKFGNILSAQLSPKKDQKEKDGTPYIGNFKKSEPTIQSPTINEAADLSKQFANAADDLPF